MKQLLMFIGLLAVLLVPPLSRAELIIYKGTEKELNTTQNLGQPINWKVFLIVDRDTGYYNRIRYGTVDGTKLYRTLVRTNSHIVQVISLNGKTYSAITRTPTDCDGQQSPGNETVLFRGLNTALKINDDSTIVFPRTFTDEGVGLFHTSSGDPGLDEGRFVLVFNSAQTLASNRAGETLEVAFARLIAYVQSLGY